MSTHFTTATPASPVAPERRDAAAPHVQLDVNVATRPLLSMLLLLAGDLIALLAAGYVAVQLKLMFEDIVRLQIYYALWPVVFLFPVVYAAVGLYSSLGLYPSAALGPADELRRATLCTSLVFLALATATFLYRQEDGARIYAPSGYSRLLFMVWWVGSLVAVPLVRSIVRGFFARYDWWGHPVAILGAGLTGRMVIEALQRQPALGLRPVVVFDDDHTKHGRLRGVPVVGPIESAPATLLRHRVQYVIVAMPGAPDERLREMYTRYGDAFPNLMIIPGLVGFSSLWVSARDLGGVIGLEVRQRLLLAGPRFCKRALDLTLTISGGLVLLPLLAALALVVKLTSRGPVFFAQDRVGRGGRHFKALKFRSMRSDAEAVLQSYLDAHPDLRAEWERHGKLRNDPRVTPIGRFLRRTSLDELPQLWNVLRGDMSLVGPRPIPVYETDRYCEHFPLYLKVRPGITGLWQISGRSDLSYNHRMELDAYYVRNWSLWLDLHILLQTIGVVLFRKGAY